METNQNTKISLPEFSLVVLIGASGSGKSTFAKTHFLPTEILSSDFFRGLVSDDENNQAATDDAFDTLHYVAAKRMQQYQKAYRHYCWPVTDITDFKLAPFHLMATEDAVHHHKTHHWHLETLTKICQADPDLLFITDSQTVDLTDANSIAQATTWWEEKTEQGGEGMVVKPTNFLAQGKHGLIQPAIKCRGKEYLRIIYGPEYTTPEQLSQLRFRQVKHKQSMALREFALGLESLHRFVQKEPLRQIHECVFGVLALESEPIDPRL